MAVPVFIDAEVTSNATAVGSATPSLPTFEAGDLLILVSAITTAGSEVAAGIDQASMPGWVQHSDSNLPAVSAVRGQFFSKIAESGESDPEPDFIATGGYVIIIASYRGASFVNDAFGVILHGASAAPTDATLLTGLADNLILRVMFCDGANITDPDLFPSGTNGRASGEIAGPGNGLSLGLADSEQLLPGTSPAAVWDLDSADETGTYQVAWPPTGPFVAQTAVVSADAPTAVLLSDLFFLGHPAWTQADAPPALILQPELFAETADVRADAPCAELTIVAEPQIRVAPVAVVSVDAPPAVINNEMLLTVPATVTANAPTALLILDQVHKPAPATVAADAPSAVLQLDLMIAISATVVADAPTAILFDPDRRLFACTAWVSAVAPPAALFIGQMDAVPADVVLDAPVAVLSVSLDHTLIAAVTDVILDAPIAVLRVDAISGPVCADPSVRPQVIANPSLGVC